MAMPPAVGSPSEHHPGAMGCRHAKLTCFCVTGLQQMQPQPGLRHHENACGSGNQDLPNPVLRRQPLCKLEKEVLDNIKILQCKA